MALILSGGGIKGSLEAVGCTGGKMITYYTLTDTTGHIDDIPTTGFTPTGTLEGCMAVNLDKKYSRVQIGNFASIGCCSVYKDDGTIIPKSADMDISDGVFMIAWWGSSSTRPTYTFTAK